MLKTCQMAVSEHNSKTGCTTGCGAAEVPDSSFKARIETGCGASEVPDSSFEGQQKQFVAPGEVAWKSNETPSKAAGRVLRLLRLLRLLRGGGNVPDGNFKAQ